jgi:hypothetical protein
VFQDRLTEVFKILNIWFKANLLSLNVSKTDYIKFTAKNFYEQDNYTNLAYGNKKISDSYHTKFSGINIINTLSWKWHVDQLLLKLNTRLYSFILNTSWSRGIIKLLILPQYYLRTTQNSIERYTLQFQVPLYLHLYNRRILIF